MDRKQQSRHFKRSSEEEIPSFSTKKLIPQGEIPQPKHFERSSSREIPNLGMPPRMLSNSSVAPKSSNDLQVEKRSIQSLTDVCRYGVDCHDKACPRWHFNNKYVSSGDREYAFGKGNLLYAATKAMPSILALYDIKVFFRNYDRFDLSGLKIGPIDLTIQPTLYALRPNEYFLIFANSQLGGGVIKFGNVQEEIFDRQLGLLQYFLKNDHLNKNSLLSNNLMRDPIVIETNVLNQYNGGLDLYGRNGVNHASQRSNLKGVYEPCVPFPINVICVAAPKITSKNQYSPKMIKSTLVSFIKAFTTTLYRAEKSDDKIIIINIGNIGCGDFKNNVNVNYILQYAAISCAIKLVAPKKIIKVIYHAFDNNIFEIIRKHAMPLLNEFITNEKSMIEIINTLWSYQCHTPSIWKDKQ